jgi:hypothetical protein
MSLLSKTGCFPLTLPEDGEGSCLQNTVFLILLYTYDDGQSAKSDGFHIIP